MEHGSGLRAKRPRVHRRGEAVRRLLLLGAVHPGHPRHDGGPLRLPAYAAFALVHTTHIINSIRRYFAEIHN
jgi:hypothetical protein